MKTILNITLILLSAIFIIQGFRVDTTIATQSELISAFGSFLIGFTIPVIIWKIN
jgi:hypothetical protein